MKENLSHSKAIPSVERMWGNRALLLTGNSYQRGLAHGKHMAGVIHEIVRNYQKHFGDSLSKLPDLRESIAKADVLFDNEALEEMRGIADGSQLDWHSILIHNLNTYSESMGTGCCQFVVSASANSRRIEPGENLNDGKMIHGANVDLPVRLFGKSVMIGCILEIHPPGALAYLTATVPGTICGILGVNACGIAASSALLLDQVDPTAPIQGQRHMVSMHQVLSQAQTLEDAVELLRRPAKHSAWGVCFSHGQQDRLCYVEYGNGEFYVDDNSSRVLGANHSTLLSNKQSPPQHSLHRRNRLKNLLDSPSPMTTAKAQNILRDQFDLERNRETRHPTMNTLRRVDNLLSMTWEPCRDRLEFAFSDGNTSQEGKSDNSTDTPWINGGV